MASGAGRWGTHLLVMVALVVAVAACSGNDGGAITNPAEQDAETSDDASSGDSLDLPENLTIPLPGGGTVTGSVSDTGYAYAFVEYPTDRYDEIVAFYVDWTGTDSRDWSGGDASYDSQGTTVRGFRWNSTASSFGVTECASTGGTGEFGTLCVQITDEG